MTPAQLATHRYRRALIEKQAAALPESHPIHTFLAIGKHFRLEDAAAIQEAAELGRKWRRSLNRPRPSAPHMAPKRK